MTRNNVLPVLLSSFDASGILGTYQPITNAGGFEQPIFYLKINNTSNQAILISFDGVNDHDYLLANSIWTINFQTNNAPNNNMAQLAKHTNVYAKGALAGIGKIYVSAWYIPQGV